ncbi:ribonuclease E/G [Actibacterium ureilyticum]|uniref:ribonuclease E/G n=1 Tax=Actibacterium ureilyticum TaxID=1590614 RepID=UPI000BAA9CC1|nr:ribonuclease E/G [Actibacterium ureilyticum]
MKGRIIVLDHIEGQPAAALMQDGRLEDLLLHPADGPPAPGAIFRAVVDRPVKGQGGVFLKLPEGQSGFLRQAKGLAPGQALLVQVTGYAEPGKAVPVTSRVLFKSRHAIVTPDAPGLNISRRIRDEDLRDGLLEIAHEAMADVPERFGLILRSAAGQADPDEVFADIEAMRDLAGHVMAEVAGVPELLVDAPDPHLMAWRDWADPAPDQVADHPGCFEDLGVLDAIDALQDPAPLPGGGAMFVEPTRALVAVDVNTGADTSPAAGLKANIAAARDLPRQLRLRGLGGQIVVDFAPMAKKDRRQLEQVLRAAFKSDSIDSTLLGWTPLGHYELTRKRERQPLSESLSA